MGGQIGKSESESQAASQFGQDVWGGQGPALQQLYQQAGGLFGDVYGQQQGLIPGATQQQQQITEAAMPAYQQQLAGGATADMGLQNMLTQSLQQSGAQPSQTSQMYANIMGGKGNTYADAMKAIYQEDASQALQKAMSLADARAVGAGQSGSSRHGVLQSNLAEDINDRLLGGLFQTGYETFDKDLQNKLAIAQQADVGTLERQRMMSGMLQGQDVAQQGGIGAGQQMQNLGMGSFAPGMMPWQSMGNYANILGRPTVLGSGTSTAGSDSKALGMGVGK